MKQLTKNILLAALGSTILASQAFAAEDISFYAGTAVPSYEDGTLAAASFNQPYGLAVDSNGTVFVADTYNNCIRKISAGQVSTYAGISGIHDLMGFPIGGLQDGTAGEAYFDKPRDLAIDANGDIIVADTNNHAIRKIHNNTVSTLAGNGTAGDVDGAGNLARFHLPSSIAIDSANQIYVADTLNNAIRVIDANGKVSTLALTSSSDTYDYSLLNEPSSIRFTADGTLYIVDSGNQLLKKVIDGVVYPVAGVTYATNSTGYVDGDYVDGTLDTAMFNFPKGICVLDNGLIFVADTWNHCIRLIKPDHTVTTFAGTNEAGNTISSLTDSRFNAPSALTYADGALLVSDMWNNCIKQIPLKYGNPIFDLDSAFVSKDIDFSSRNPAIVNVAVNHQLIDFADVTTLNIDGKTYFPIRAIAEALGADVAFDSDSRTIQITYRGRVVTYALDNTPLQIVGNRSLLHIRTLASDMGFFVSWNAAYNTVVITD